MRGLHFGNQANAVLYMVLAIEKRSRDLLVIEYETRRRAQFLKEARKFSKVHAEKAIIISKPCVSGKCCVVSMNFDEILSE